MYCNAWARSPKSSYAMPTISRTFGSSGRKRERRLYARNGLFAKLFLAIEQPQTGLRKGIARVVPDRLFEKAISRSMRFARFLFVFEAFVGDSSGLPHTM